MNLPRVFGVALSALVLAGPPSHSAAQSQNLERVRALYVAAAYEEALAAMPPVPTDPAVATRTDLEQYRALCLLALGREQEAIAAVERLITDHPTFVPSASDTSPRMRSMFETARARLVPEVARATYAEAKADFDRKQTGAARGGFTRTIELIDSLQGAEKSALADLRQLASGFLELSAVGPALPRVPPIPENGAAEATPGATDYVAPIPVREELPVWTPPDGHAMRTEYNGLLQVAIGEDGTVRSATMVKSSHPLYDAAIMRAARLWIYKPATRGGKPVASFKNIQVRLVPR